jgi:hypothetical protein
VFVWNAQTDGTHILRVDAWQNGYEFRILFCEMKELINWLRWGFLLAFPTGYSGRRPLVFRQLPLSAVARPEASDWQTQPDQLRISG